MTYTDPMHGGPTSTLDPSQVSDEQYRAVLTLMRQFGGGEELWPALDMLGLTTTAQEMLSERRRALGLAEPIPEPHLTLVKPPTARSAPNLPYPDRPAHRQGPPEWAKQRRRDEAIARARALLAEAWAAEELPPCDENDVVIPRCTRRIHYKIGDNVRMRANGTGSCIACDKIRQAQSLLRQYGVKW